MADIKARLTSQGICEKIKFKDACEKKNFFCGLLKRQTVKQTSI